MSRFSHEPCERLLHIEARGWALVAFISDRRRVGLRTRRGLGILACIPAVALFWVGCESKEAASPPLPEVVVAEVVQVAEER